ncbi:MAG: ribosome recycling factor [Deltaproteobacteria bacterium]|nr:ribosome recycling factor [Deltaproteobacteria bacterium]
MEEEIFADLQHGLDAAIEHFRHECGKLRTGRANASLMDGVRVDYYGSESPLNQVATVSVVDARLLQIKPWERNMCGPIEKAILAANLGLTPSNRGDVVLVPIPPMTGERRKELVKVVKHMAEVAKTSCRNARRDAIDFLEALEDYPEDDLTRSKKKVQDMIDASTKRIDTIEKEKEAEVLEV